MYQIDVAPTDVLSITAETFTDYVVATFKASTLATGSPYTFTCNIYTTTSGFAVGDDLTIRI